MVHATVLLPPGHGPDAGPLLLHARNRHRHPVIGLTLAPRSGDMEHCPNCGGEIKIIAADLLKFAWKPHPLSWVAMRGAHRVGESGVQIKGAGMASGPRLPRAGSLPAPARALEGLPCDATQIERFRRAFGDYGLDPARDHVKRQPAFALEVARMALQWMASGVGYELTSADVCGAREHAVAAAESIGLTGGVGERIAEHVAALDHRPCGCGSAWNSAADDRSGRVSEPSVWCQR